MTRRAKDTQFQGQPTTPVPKSFSKQSRARAKARVPAARWWVEEPLDYTWHGAHPQVLLAAEGDSLGKGLTAWSSQAEAQDCLGGWQGHWQRSLEEQEPAQDTVLGSRGDAQSRITVAGANNPSRVCPAPDVPKDYLPTSVM